MIGEFSKMTGIPVRTLHYYDESDLLKPNRQANGHRIYTLDDLVKLQKILSLKSLGFSLGQVSDLLKHSHYDQSLIEMLKLQQQSLQKKREKIDESLELISRIMMVVQVEEQLEHQMLFSLIRNMMQENMHQEWVVNNLSELTAEKLFSNSTSETAKIDAETVRFFQDVKRLSSEPVDSEEVETVIGAYVEWVMTFFDQKALDNLLELSENDQNKLAQFVDMPISESELIWLEQALKQYFLKHPLYMG